MSSRPGALCLIGALLLPATPAAARPLRLVAPAPAPTASGPADAPRLRLTSRAQALTLTGATSLGLGGILLAATAGALILGRHDRKASDGITATAEAEQRPLSLKLQAEQAAYDRRLHTSEGLALAAGITGGVLAVAGAVLLGTGLGLRARARRLTPRASLGGLGLHLSF